MLSNDKKRNSFLMIKVPQRVLPTYRMIWEGKACLMEEINCMALKILSYKATKKVVLHVAFHYVS
jgi:hypothetical protein